MLINRARLIEISRAPVQDRLRWGIVALAAVNILLVVFGAVRIPAALRSSPVGGWGPAAPIAVLLVYGLVGWFGPERTIRVNPQILRIGIISGLVAASIYVIETLAEYVLLPEDNTTLGLVEFGLVFAVFLTAGYWLAYRTDKVEYGLLAAVWAALISSLVWYLASLLVFYLFFGTPAQTQVFRGEGNFQDFARSGMADFYAFMVQDYWGAGFFHLLFIPAVAAVLGAVGGWAGKAVDWLRKA